MSEEAECTFCCFKEGDRVERRIDGYTDDGNMEDNVDENDLRLQVITLDEKANTNSNTIIITKVPIEDYTCCPAPEFYSADDLLLVLRPTIRTFSTSGSAYDIPASLTLPPRVRHRRWSFESSRAVTAALLKQLGTGEGAGAESETSLMQLRLQRYDTEDPQIFAPLAARCANPTCRRLTIYRCHRCNQSFSCSVACQKRVWASGHSQQCAATPFTALFTTPPPLPPPVTAVAVSVQNDWLADDQYPHEHCDPVSMWPTSPTASTGTDIEAWTGTPISKSMTHLDELCTTIEGTTLLDYNSNRGGGAKSSTAFSAVASTTTSTTYNPLRGSGSSTTCSSSTAGGRVLDQVLEASGSEDEQDEFSRKVIQLSEAFSRPTIEVSRVLRYFAKDEDAAVECLVMGESKSEEEVTAEVNRMARSRQARRLRAAGGAAAVTPPAYSHAMMGIDEEEDTSSGGGTRVNRGTELTERTAVGGSSEDWSHLYVHPSAHPNSLDGYDEDDEGIPPLIDADDCLDLPPAPSTFINDSSFRDKDCGDSEGWWRDTAQHQEWASPYPQGVTAAAHDNIKKALNHNRVHAANHNYNCKSSGKPLDSLDSRSTTFAPVGTKTLLYFVLNPEHMALPRPLQLIPSVAGETEPKSVILFEGPVFLGKRAAKMMVTCAMKSCVTGALSVDKISVEIEPRDNIEALWIESSGKSGMSPSLLDLAVDEHQERLIDVDEPLPDLLVMLSAPPPLPPPPSNSPANSPSYTRESLTYTLHIPPPHVHELNLDLTAAIDVMLLFLEQEQQQHEEVAGTVGYDSFAMREWLDACFWQVAAAVRQTELESTTYDSRKRSSSTEEPEQEQEKKGEKAARMLEPHALGVLLVRALLLHMRTGLLNPFSREPNNFFHESATCDDKNHYQQQQHGKGGYMQYVLLAYQVRYVTLSTGDTPSPGSHVSCPHIIQSDRAERVPVHQEKVVSGTSTHTATAAGAGEGEEDLEEKMQELIDILMVDRNTARSALVANSGDLNQSMEWLLSKLDYS